MNFNPENQNQTRSDETFDDSISIGDLLAQAGLITQEQLNLSMQLSFKMRTPLERILSMQGYLNTDLFAQALAIQRLIETRSIGLTNGVTALKSIKHEKMTLEEALDKNRELLPVSQPLGETLLAIGAITDKQLQSSLKVGLLSLLPIGWTLAAQGIISQLLYGSALTAQSLLQKNILPKEQILYCLRLARLQQQDLRKILIEAKIDTAPIDHDLLISHLLIQSGVLFRSEILCYRELALLDNAELETTLSKFNVLNERALLSLNDSFLAVTSNDLDASQAIITLRKLNQVDWDLTKLEQEPENADEPISITDLLNSAKILTAKQLALLMEESIQNRQPVYDVLVKQALLEQSMLDALRKCKQLVDYGLLAFEQAVLLLLYCAECKCDLLTAFAQFGWQSLLVDA
jgi:hypothetical protein